MNFSNQVLSFYKSLTPDWNLPMGIDIIFPFEDSSILNLMSTFYKKFYADKNRRHFMFGINPGRLGAGMTGVPFTDPIRLQEVCMIPNEITKKQELSSVFIYDMISNFGSPEYFYSKFYISSISPLGFTKNGKNYNYYDSRDLFDSVYDNIVASIDQQVKFYCHSDVAFSIGHGKNFKIFKELNAKYKWFGDIVPLPHPRWVMQYKLKTKQTYLDEYFSKLTAVIKT